MSGNVTDEEKKKRFLEKHPPLSQLKAGEELVKDPETGDIMKRKVSFTGRPKTVEEEWAAQERAKKKYEGNIQKVEENLINFLKIEDPIIFDGKAIAWMRRPSNKEIRELVPKEMMVYADNPVEMPDELMEKYDKGIYAMMEKLITKPEWSAEKWELNNNPWFTRLFWGHITNIIRITQAEIEGF